VVQVYPGLCNPTDVGCPGGMNLCIATPDDPTDQLQTNWTKDAKRTGVVNPIVNATQRDPSTAWQIDGTGEWQLTIYGSQIYGSMDFKTWVRSPREEGTKSPRGAASSCVIVLHRPASSPLSSPCIIASCIASSFDGRCSPLPSLTHAPRLAPRADARAQYAIGKQSAFPGGECPSFFPLPPTTPGAGAAPTGAPNYTHVHKTSHNHRDWMQVGVYTPPRATDTLGNWSGQTEVKIDQGPL
jgi:hypothetical protein